MNKQVVSTIIGTALIGLINPKKKMGSHAKWFRFLPKSIEEFVSAANNIEYADKVDALYLTEVYENLDESEYPEGFPSHIIEHVGNFKNLKNLGLSDIELSALPSSFSNLTNLKKINLSFNNFDHIPQVLKDLPALEKVDLSYNKRIETFSASDLMFVNKFNEINLSRCRLKTLPEDFVSTLGSRVKKINLDGNLGLIRSPVEYLLKLLDSGFPVDLFLKTFRSEDQYSYAKKNEWYYYYSSFTKRRNRSFFMADDIPKFSKDPVWMATRKGLSVKFRYEYRGQEIDYSKRQSLMNEVLTIVTRMKRLTSFKILPFSARADREPVSKKTDVILPNSIVNLTHLEGLTIDDFGTVVIPTSIKNLDGLTKVNFYDVDKVVGLSNLGGIEYTMVLTLDYDQINFEELYTLENVTELTILNENLVLPEGIDSMKNLRRLNVPHIISIPDSILNVEDLSILNIEADRGWSSWKKKKQLRIPLPMKIMQAVKKGFKKNIAKNIIRVYSEIPAKSQLRKF